MAHSTPEGGVPPERHGREIFDLDVSYVRWFSLGIIVLVIATAAAAFVMLNGFRISHAATAAPQATEGSAAAYAVLQSAPQDELRAYRRSKATALEGYHWVDRTGGVVQIPIERAMELVAGEGVTPSVTQGVAPGRVAPGSKPAAPAVPQPDGERTR